MSVEDERRPSRIPEFASIEEEAEFWDTHDFTDFLDESWPVQIRVSPDFTSIHRTTITLSREEWRELERRAGALGTDPTTLAQRWVGERLQQEEAGAERATG